MSSNEILKKKFPSGLWKDPEQSNSVSLQKNNTDDMEVGEPISCYESKGTVGKGSSPVNCSRKNHRRKRGFDGRGYD